MYSRFLIPLLKPDLKKVIYSDIDVAFVKDINLLYNIDLEDYTIAAVTSYRMKQGGDFYLKAKQRLNLDTKHDFFMSGLLVIDVEKWNADNTTEKLLGLTQKLSSENKLVLPDQDALNKCFECNYFKLDKRFGIIPKFLRLVTVSEK